MIATVPSVVLTGINARAVNRVAIITLNVLVKKQNQIEELISKIASIEGIETVYRK